MVDTYGFGGSEPTTNVASGSPGAKAQDVQTGTGFGDTGPSTFGKLEDLHTDQIRGNSPVSGLGIVPTWNASVSGAEISYVGNNASQTGAGANSNIGAWPAKFNDPHAGRGTAITSQVLPNRPNATDVYGNVVGDDTVGIIP